MHIAAVDGLIWKVWIINEETQEAGGIHLFENEASLNAHLGGPIVAQLTGHPNLSDFNVKQFDVMEEPTTITRGPIGEKEIKEDSSYVFFMSLSEGLNMISLPLKPQTPYTARSFAEELSATVVIKFDEARQRFAGFTLDVPDNGFPIEGGKGYIVNVPEAKVVAFTGAAWTNQPPVEAAPSLVGANPMRVKLTQGTRS